MTVALEQFAAAARGEILERPLVTGWLHLGTAHLPPEVTADLYLRFQAEFEWDFVKVMHDYRYDIPLTLGQASGTDVLAAVAESLAPGSLDVQRKVLDRVLGGRSGSVPVVETVFTPFQTLIRSAGSQIVPALKAEPAAAQAALDTITARLVDHIEAVRELGVDGIFVSVNGAAGSPNGWDLTDEQYESLVAPYDRRLLDAAGDLVRICHVHGAQLHMHRLRGYEYDVLSWSSSTTAPKVEEVWAEYGVVPMTGLDEVGCLYYTADQVAAEVQRAWQATAGRLVVAPGCTPHTDTPPSVFRALRDAVTALERKGEST